MFTLCPGGAVARWSGGSAGWSAHRSWLRNVAGLHHGRSSVLAAYRWTPARMAGRSARCLALAKAFSASRLPTLFGNRVQNSENSRTEGAAGSSSFFLTSCLDITSLGRLSNPRVSPRVSRDVSATERPVTLRTVSALFLSRQFCTRVRAFSRLASSAASF